MPQTISIKFQPRPKAGSSTPCSPNPSAAEEWRGSPREERTEAYSVLTARSLSQTPGPGGFARNSAKVTSLTELYPCDLVSQTQPDSDSEFQALELTTMVHMYRSSPRVKPCLLLHTHGLPAPLGSWHQYCISSLQRDGRGSNACLTRLKPQGNRLSQELSLSGLIPGLLSLALCSFQTSEALFNTTELYTSV